MLRSEVKVDREELEADVARQMLGIAKNQLLEQGYKYYCPTCTTVDEVIASNEPGTCEKCTTTEYVSFDNLD